MPYYIGYDNPAFVCLPIFHGMELGGRQQTDLGLLGPGHLTIGMSGCIVAPISRKELHNFQVYQSRRKHLQTLQQNSSFPIHLSR